MADKKNLVNVECKILKFEDNPKGGQNVFVECKLGARTWIKTLWVNYDRPISFEEFKRDLAAVTLIPPEPEDPLAYVKEEAEGAFTIEVSRKPV